MVITGIQIQKGNKSIAVISLEKEPSFCLHKEICLKYRLYTGMEISPGQMEEMLSESGKKLALDKALNCVSRKQCSEKALKDYLKGKGFDESSLNFAVSKIKEYGYINDGEYAKNFVIYSGGNKGRLKIACELKNRGISADIINGIGLDREKETEKCIAEAVKFIKGKEKDEKLREKLYRHLAYRGFDSETVITALSAVLGGDTEDNQDV